MSWNKMLVSLLVYLILSGLTTFSCIRLGVSALVILVYAITLVGSAFLSIRLVKNKVVLWRTAEGLVFARGGNISYMIWFGGFVLRIIIGFAFLGPGLFFSLYGAQKTIDATDLWSLILSDVVMMVGVGALTGRTFHVMSRLKNM